MTELDWLKENIRFEQLIEEYGGDKIKRSGDQWTLSSPLRPGDENPSFIVDVRRKIWNDFATGDSGDVVSFVSILINAPDLRNAEHIKLVCEFMQRYCPPMPDDVKFKPKAQLQAQPNTRKKQIPISHPPLNLNDVSANPLRKALSADFISRGISASIVQELNIGLDNQERLIIPFRREEGVSYEYKALRYSIQGGKLTKQIADNSTARLWPAIPDEQTIVIAAGENDCMALLSNGIPAVTNSSGESTWRDEWSEKFKGKRVVILYDLDAAGDKGAQKAAASLHPHVELVRIASWETIVGDVDKKGFDTCDFFQRGGDANYLKQQLADARIWTPSGEYDETDISKQKLSYREIEEIQKEIYFETESGKSRLIPDKVAELVIEKFHICSTRNGRNKVFRQYQNGVWKEIFLPQIEHLYRNWLKPLDRDSAWDKIKRNIDNRAFVHPDAWDKQPHLLPLKNCCINLNTLLPEPHKPENYFTAKADYSYEYGASCPEYKKQLRLYSKDDASWVQTIQEIHGYILRGDLPFQKMFWFTGSSGRNGKGTVVRVLENLVGLHYTRADLKLDDLSNRFSKKELIGKRLAVAGDLPPFLKNVPILKQLTGGDRQASDTKGGDEVTFVNVAKLVFAMNQLPQLPVEEQVSPIAKRVVILPFEYRIEKPDSTIEGKLIAELPGILNWALDGLRRLMDQKEFSEGVRSEKMRNNFIGHGDMMTAFLETYFEIADNDTDAADENFYVEKSIVMQLWYRYMAEMYGPAWDKIRDNISSIRSLTPKITQRSEHISTTRRGFSMRGTQSVFQGLKLSEHGTSVIAGGTGNSNQSRF